MSENIDILLKEVLSTVKSLNEIKLMIQKTDEKVNNIVSSLSKYTDITEMNSNEIEKLNEALKSIQEDLKKISLDVLGNTADIGNIYYVVKRVEEKEDRWIRYKKSIQKAFTTIVSNRFAIAIWTSLILFIFYILVHLGLDIASRFLDLDRETVEILKDAAKRGIE